MCGMNVMWLTVRRPYENLLWVTMSFVCASLMIYVRLSRESYDG